MCCDLFTRFTVMKDMNTEVSHTEVNPAPMTEAAVSEQTPETTVEQRDSRAKYNKFAFISIVLTIAAWIILTLNGKVALGGSILAFFCGCIGLKSSTRTWRNTAITSIVASAVLMVVLAAFLIVIFVGLNSI